jgi:hypothetical protein
MMAALLRLGVPTVMNIDLNCGEIRHKTCYEDDIVVNDRRTTRRDWCGYRKCPRLEHGGCHISLCWTVFLIVIIVVLWCPGSSFGKPVPGTLEGDWRVSARDGNGRQKRAIIGDNVVSTTPKVSHGRTHTRLIFLYWQ